MAMKRLCLLLLMLGLSLLPLTAAAFFGGNVPSAADDITKQLDKQLMMRYAGRDPGMTKANREAVARAGIMILGTSPANINDLTDSSPLARQMMEEISRGLIEKGYRFKELRTGSYVRFDRDSGEFLLTRDVKKLESRTAKGQAVMAGTYVVTRDQVRFSIRLIHIPSNEVMAMGTATVPITDDIYPLLRDPYNPSRSNSGVPSSYTRLQ